MLEIHAEAAEDSSCLGVLGLLLLVYLVGALDDGLVGVELVQLAKDRVDAEEELELVDDS